MCGSCLRDTDNNSSDYITEVPKTKKQKKTDYWFSKYNRVLHHYSVSIAAAACYGFDQYFGCFENLQSIIIWERCATGSDVTEKDVTGKDVTGSDVSQVTRSDVSHMTGSVVSHVTGSDIITGSDVIFPALFFLVSCTLSSTHTSEISWA